MIFMDQPAEPIPANDAQRTGLRSIIAHRRTVRRYQVQASVSPMPIVMIAEGREHALEVTGIQNEKPIEAFSMNGPYKSFGDPVRLWCLDRRRNNSDPRAPKDVVKGAGEFAIAKLEAAGFIRMKTIGRRKASVAIKRIIV